MVSCNTINWKCLLKITVMINLMLVVDGKSRCNETRYNILVHMMAKVGKTNGYLMLDSKGHPHTHRFV